MNNYPIDKNKKPIYVVLFVSRNKDNVDIENFKERRQSFITSDLITDKHLLDKFYYFVNQGVPGEMSRMYYSVNERDSNKLQKKLIHFLIDEDDFNMTAINSKIAGLAASHDCAKEKKWLFDFDINDIHKASKFCEDIKKIDSEIRVDIHKTPNGYAIISSRGFDTRELLAKWPEVTLKRDDLYCVSWSKK